MVKMAVGAGTDSNANPGLKRRGKPATGVAPAMLAAPGLSGPGLVGASMRVDTGVWGGVPAPVLSPRWRRNGVEISGAAGVEYTPVAADDGADLDCVVTASNASGTASAATGTVRITRAAPVATGAFGDRVLDQGQAAVTLDASAAFNGAALTFGVSGAGASVAPATGILSIPADTPRAAETVTVTATNSGGSASASFTVTVIAAPVETAPASLVAPSLAGSGRVGELMRVDAGTWDGEPTPVLSSRWRRNGADIPGADGDEYVPAPADEGTDLDCVVVAVNVAGWTEAVTASVRIVHAAPSARAALPDAVFDQGGGVASLPTAQAFTGEDLTFGVTGGGAVIDPASGWIGLGTDLPRAAETVTVTATNSGGSASVSFTVTVVEVVVDTAAPVLVVGVFDAAASPATLSFSADEGGTAFWLVDGVTTRSAAEVEAGGGAISGDFVVGAGATARDVDLAPLSPGVWNMHLMVRDAAGNRSNVTSSVFDFAPSDLAAPILSGMVVTAGQKEAMLSVSTDEAGGTLYWMVDTSPARTAAQIRAGGGTDSGSRAVSATGAQASLTASGLTSATRYHFHAMHEDAAGNLSAPLSTAFTTTTAATTGIEIIQHALALSDTTYRSSGYAWTSGAFTVGATGANKILLALVNGGSASASAAPPTDLAVTFGGEAMAEAQPPTGDFANAGVKMWSAAYVLPAPASGSGTLTVSTAQGMIVMSVVLVEIDGVDQTTPIPQWDLEPFAEESLGVDVIQPCFLTVGEGSLLIGVRNQIWGTDVEMNRGGVASAGVEMIRFNTGPSSSSDLSVIIATLAAETAGSVGFNFTRVSGSVPNIVTALEIKRA